MPTRAATTLPPPSDTSPADTQPADTSSADTSVDAGSTAKGPTSPGWFTRRIAALALVLGLLVAGGLMSAFGSAEPPARGSGVPVLSESARAEALAAQLPGGDEAPVLLVATRADGSALTPQDLEAISATGTAAADVGGHWASPAMPAPDGLAATVAVPLDGSGGSEQTAELVKGVREAVAQTAPSDLVVQVTGGPAFGVDVAAAFEGADFTLLLVTVSIVALLLLLTYRSPILWLAPLLVVGLADRVAAGVTAALGSAYALEFDSGIVSVLVFGAGTNYALLLVSRYREELRLEGDHRVAMRRAWQATFPAILASNLTVVLALLTLALAVIPGTHGLGVTCAVGLLIALVAVLFLLPPVLVLCGRGIFWPFVPRPGSGGRQEADADPVSRSLFGRAAHRVMHRPVAVLGAGLLTLGVLATGLVGTQVGLSQTEKFRVSSESAAGLETLSAHLPAGQAAPLTVLVPTDSAQRAEDAIADVTGVEHVRAGQAGEVQGTSWTPLSVIGAAEPGTPESRALVEEVRTTAHATDADALVGGSPALDVDARAGAEHDLRLIAPLVLAVSALVLLVLTRSVVAPIVLLAVNALSSLAAIGAGAWIGRTVFGFPALDTAVPLLAFLFLVALGIDYTIFLVHRARAEAQRHGTADGMVRAVATTGGVITSAGIVLAAVFAALGVLPLVTLGQIGLIVGIGVLIDAFLVRTLVVPALFGALGDRIWWPGRIARTDERDQPDHGDDATGSHRTADAHATT